MILNQDTVALMPGWAGDIFRLFGVPVFNVGLVGPKLLFGNGAIQSCGGLFDAGKGPYHRYLGWQDKDDRRVNRTEIVKWTTGAAMMLRTEDFWACGGLDESYRRGYFEDVDLCMKVRFNLGKEIWYCAEAEFGHDPGSTGGNPEFFMANSRLFHSRWDSKIIPDTQQVFVNF